MEARIGGGGEGQQARGVEGRIGGGVEGWSSAKCRLKRRKIVFISTSVAFVTLTTRTVQKYLFIVYGYFSLPIS